VVAGDELSARPGDYPYSTLDETIAEPGRSGMLCTRNNRGVGTGGLTIAGTWGAPISQSCFSDGSTMPKRPSRNVGHKPLSDNAERLKCVMSLIMPLCMYVRLSVQLLYHYLRLWLKGERPWLV
jgi:hypothetical protein